MGLIGWFIVLAIIVYISSSKNKKNKNTDKFN